MVHKSRTLYLNVFRNGKLKRNEFYILEARTKLGSKQNKNKKLWKP